LTTPCDRPAREAIAEHAEIVDRQPWLSLVEERFGIPKQAFDDYLVVRPNRRSLHLVPRDHRPPPRPAPQIIGMSFLRTRMRFPKLTTAAAMTFGPLASRNHVGVDRAQADAFLSRTPFAITAARAEACTGIGYVLVRREEIVLGVGFFRPGDDGGGQVQSFFPKAWTLAEDESAFEP
jgi:hypothetical protein